MRYQNVLSIRTYNTYLKFICPALFWSSDYFFCSRVTKLSINWNCPGKWCQRLCSNGKCLDNWFRRLSINWICSDSCLRGLSINWNCLNNWCLVLKRIGIVWSNGFGVSFNWNCPDNWSQRLSINLNWLNNWCLVLSVNWNCPTNNLGHCLSIGIVLKIVLTGCLLIGIAWTIDVWYFQKVGIVWSNGFGVSINWNCPDNWFQRLSINLNWLNNWCLVLSINWNCPTNNLGHCLSIGIVLKIVFTGCLLIGIA